MTDTPETMAQEIERLRLAVDRAAEVIDDRGLCVKTFAPLWSCGNQEICFDCWRDWLMRENVREGG